MKMTRTILCGSMPNANVDIIQGIVVPPEAQRAFFEILNDTPWRQDSIVIFGKRVRQPHFNAWYGDAGASYIYSGLRHKPLPWNPLLLSIKVVVEELTGANFNSCLLNLYRDQNDGIGMHSDNEPELGDEPVIASLSLGATRTLRFKPKTKNGLSDVKIDLEHGTLLLMRGQTQRNWKHGIAKQKTICGPRINLTFRTIKHLSET
jgi:alkylated DNA repair dioxygenase AlkB